MPFQTLSSLSKFLQWSATHISRHQRSYVVVTGVLILVGILLYAARFHYTTPYDESVHFKQPFNARLVTTGWNLSDINFEDDMPDWIHDYIRFHNSPDTPDTQYLVWACTTTSLCGGIGDRIRGIVSAFYLALVTRRKLLIYSPTPVDLGEFLQPARFDWTRDAQYRYANADLDLEWYCVIKQEMFNFFDGQYDRHHTIILRTNMFIWTLIMNGERYAEFLDKLKIPSGIWTGGYEELLFNWAWRAIMRPSKKLQSEIIALRQHHGLTGEFIAVQIRRGGHFRDPERHADLQPFVGCLANMTQVVGELPVYLSTDDIDTRQQFSDLCPLTTIRYDHAEPFHIDECDGTDLTERVLRTWAEFFLFTAASCVVGSRSGFSEWPVAISRHPQFGSRCYARFDRCSMETIRRSRTELVPQPIWRDSYPSDLLSGALI